MLLNASSMVKLFKKAPKEEEETVFPFYDSIRIIPVFNFYKVLETGDHSFLYIAEKGKEDLTEVWKEIYNQYCVIAKIDNAHLKQITKVEEIRKKIIEVELLLEKTITGTETVRQKARQILKNKHNYIFRENHAFVDEFERLKGQLDVLKTKLNIEEKKLPKEQKKEGISIMKKALMLENMFPGRVIDIYTMPMEKFQGLLDLAEEKAIEQKKLKKK